MTWIKKPKAIPTTDANGVCRREPEVPERIIEFPQLSLWQRIKYLLSGDSCLVCIIKRRCSRCDEFYREFPGYSVHTCIPRTHAGITINWKCVRPESLNAEDLERFERMVTARYVDETGRPVTPKPPKKKPSSRKR